ncbi:MAG: DNA polymerase IV [Anaerolineae bacterium]|nr:DNA polymerase IV [Gemmatimonadaceae bacterium]
MAESHHAPPRRILLADADAFFVAVARLVDPDGAGKADLLIVGGERNSRGVVCSASYSARKFGVRSAMPIARAVRLCPDALCVPIPRRACSEKSREIRRVLARYAPIVETASIDEWYMDLGGTEDLYRGESLATTAGRVRLAVQEATGLSVSIGGGTSKLIAKMAVEAAKPKPGTGATGVQIVERGTEAEWMRRFELADIPLVGPKFQERLGKLGLRTVDDVLQHDLPALTRWLSTSKREALWLFDRVRGIDDSAVHPGEQAKSISRDETFAKDIGETAELERELLRLATRAAFDLRNDDLAARTITVRIRDFDFRTRQASRTLPEAVISDRVIFATARSLLAKLRRARRVRARLLGVALSSLAPYESSSQMTLFAEMQRPDSDTERDRALAKSVDFVRDKFGAGAIVPAGLK